MAARVRVWGALAPSLLLSLSWLALAAVAPRNARACRAESEEVRADQYVERYGKVRAHAAPHCACASPDAALWPTPVSASLAGRRACRARLARVYARGTAAGGGRGGILEWGWGASRAWEGVPEEKDCWTVLHHRPSQRRRAHMFTLSRRGLGPLNRT